MVHDQLHCLHTEKFVVWTLSEGLNKFQASLALLVKLWQVNGFKPGWKLGSLRLKELISYVGCRAPDWSFFRAIRSHSFAFLDMRSLHLRMA